MAGVYSIPFGYSVLDSLASYIWQKAGKDPLLVSQMEIYLPSRRACLELKNTLFHQEPGKCFLLPKLRPLGDLDEDHNVSFLPPVIPPLKRLGLLVNLINSFTTQTNLPSSPALDLKLAKNLVKLMDQATLEEVSWENLVNVVPQELAHHWQITLDFLDIILKHWPKILNESGYIEPYTHHALKVEALLEEWKKTPPDHEIIAAGSTASVPSTARLLAALSHLPQGKVILHGIDSTLNNKEAKELPSTHPHHSLSRFLEKMSLSPSQVPLWGDGECGDSRALERGSLFHDALRPIVGKTNSSSPKALENVTLMPCENVQEEALVISILMRQHLETPDQRIALVTPDATLAERVYWDLKRWGIEIDSSLGESLSLSPSSIFLKLCLEFCSSPGNQVALLSLLKHPLFCLGKPMGGLREDIRTFERLYLREERYPYPQWVLNFLELAHPLQFTKEKPFRKILEAHIQLAKSLSIDEEGVCHLLEGAKGKSTQDFLDSLLASADDFPSLTLPEYAGFFGELLKGERLRFRPERHPRLFILSPIEARLFRADVMILGGLNEGTWPMDQNGDPWLSRSMRQKMGFLPFERLVGLSAHDFGQVFSSPVVYLTRSLKKDGTPTQPCRWVERLQVTLKAWGLELQEEDKIRQWATYLDKPESIEPATPPRPTPPLSARPRRVSVTQVEKWMRDPYALYAQRILNLKQLNPLNPTFGPAEKGSLIHQIFDQFFKICPDPCDKNALDVLLMVGHIFFDDKMITPFEWPRFQQLAGWFIEQERETRVEGTVTFTEVKGKMAFETAVGPFVCSAKADRIDVLPNGSLRILDYKTGVVPTDTDVRLGFSPQLPLEGAIALQQGFEGIQNNRLEKLEYWALKGDTKGGVIKTLSGDPHDLSVQALEGLKNLVELFENAETPYLARPLQSKELKYNEYAQLCRLQEWGQS